MSFDSHGRKVIIIGGAGFIGHNLALTLARLGAEVTLLDSLQVNNLFWFQSDGADSQSRELYLAMINQRLDMLRSARIPVLVVDARDPLALGSMIKRIKPNVIIHLSAVSDAGRSNKDPSHTFDHSLRTLQNALDCARKIVDHFIFFSSSMVYGNFMTDEVDEEDPLNPIGIYAAMKLAGEKLVIAYQQVFDLPYTIIRPSALYGPRCVSRRVIQIFLENALSGKTLRISGDGSEKLDFTYIDDLIEGVCRVVQRPGARNQIFNMTYGGARTILDLAVIVQDHFPHVQIEHVERRELMPFRGTLSINKAKDLLGYQPKISLEKGVASYAEWYRGLEFFESVPPGRR